MNETLLVVASLLSSVLLTWVMIRQGPKLGLVDEPGERRIHTKVTPRAGGVAIWITLLLVFFSWNGLGNLGRTGLNGDWIFGFLVSSAILVFVGLIDDRWGLPAMWKLFGQIVASVVFFFLNGKAGGHILGIEVPFVLDLIVTVAWFVLLINAFNLIDGMDGLCAGLGVISFLCMALLSASFGHLGDATLMVAMAASLVGFLCFNFNPAKIFLGDAGSMLIGFSIASISNSSVGERAAVVSLLIPLLVAGVPLFDVLFAVWRRSARAWIKSFRSESRLRELFEPDKDHLHHRLLACGFSQRKAVLVLYGVALFLAVVACAPFFLDERALGLSMTLLGVLILTGFRYVAPVELRVSGDLLHLALKKPSNARLVAASYFFYDVTMLSFVVVAAAYVESSAMVRVGTILESWPTFLVVLVFAMVSLRLGRAHSRHWSRATLRDTVSVLLWFSLGLTLSFTVSTFLARDIAWSNFRFFLIVAIFGGVSLMIPRLFTVALRELIIDSQHRSLFRSKGLRERVVVYGAGDLGELFLHHLKVTEPTQLVERRILGFLDDNPNITNKSMDGFRIFGGVEDLGGLVERFGIQGVVVCATRLDPKKAELLNKASCELGLKVFRWRPRLSLAEVSFAGDIGTDETIKSLTA